MPLKSIRQALNEALAQEMRRDPRVVVIGEDVAGGAGSQGQRDAYGGVLGVTKGLIGEKFVQISPGGSDKIIPPNGKISEVEPPIDLEELLSKYVFGKV